MKRHVKRLWVEDIVPMGVNEFNADVRFIDEEGNMYAWAPAEDEVEELCEILNEYTDSR